MSRSATSQFFSNYRQVTLSRDMTENFERVGDLLKWNRRLLSVGGIWPLESTYVRSAVWIIYLTIHLSMEYADLFAVFGDLELMVTNLLETVMQTMILAKLVVIRHSKMLRSLIVAIEQDFAFENYANYEEREIYLKYNLLAKLFFKLTIPSIISGATLYYLKPLEHFIRTMHRNDTSPFVLPFRTRLFFSVSDTKTYLMVYAYQSPMIYVLVCHSAWICLLITMVLHICGQLSVLEYRIKNIKVSLSNENDDSNAIFGKLVEKHLRSIWMAKSLDDTFHLVLLQDLGGTTLLLGLTSYLVIVSSQMEISVFCIFIMCAITTVLLLFGYCLVGEFLIDESTKVHEAFYQCDWPESSTNFRRCLMICMSTTQEPLRLSAGKLYIFSLNSFTDVLRSAMAYLSMIKNFA